jgi:hypothetical protein
MSKIKSEKLFILFEELADKIIKYLKIINKI